MGIGDQSMTRTSDREMGAITNNDVGIRMKRGADGGEITRG
jgi:hypothetical protein